MYSGYFKLGKNKHLHYLYFNSESNPDTDPLIVWFNGGPGGPSIPIGLLGGVGPFAAIDLNTVVPWKYSWTRNASLLFIDNPAGVGYSYANRDIDIKHSDYSYQ